MDAVLPLCSCVWRTQSAGWSRARPHHKEGEIAKDGPQLPCSPRHSKQPSVNTPLTQTACATLQASIASSSAHARAASISCGVQRQRDTPASATSVKGTASARATVSSKGRRSMAIAGSRERHTMRQSRNHVGLLALTMANGIHGVAASASICPASLGGSSAHRAVRLRVAARCSTSRELAIFTAMKRDCQRSRTTSDWKRRITRVRVRCTELRWPETKQKPGMTTVMRMLTAACSGL
eukprot:6175295-Pleurochrysis_carterae.AAC.6